MKIEVGCETHDEERVITGIVEILKQTRRDAPSPPPTNEREAGVVEGVPDERREE